MGFSMDNDFTYMIYRDETVSTDSYGAAPLRFFPAKDSDELYDALRAKYPHLKKHSERMGQATIEFLNEELLAKEQVEQASHNISVWQGMDWPLLQDDDLASLIDFESFSGSSMTSPFTSSTQEASPWQSSPETANLSYTGDTFLHASFQTVATNTSDELGGMSSVFSLVPGECIKQRSRRKMTEAEKVEYRKRRAMKACESCSKRKRKCTHNQKVKTTAKSIAKPSCTSGVQPAGPTWDMDALINFDDFTSPLDDIQDAGLFDQPDVNIYCNTALADSFHTQHLVGQWWNSGSSSNITPALESYVPSASSGGAEAGRTQGLLRVETVLRGRLQERLHHLDQQNTALNDRLDHDRVLDGGLLGDRPNDNLSREGADHNMLSHGNTQSGGLNHSMLLNGSELQERQRLGAAQAGLLDTMLPQDTAYANSNSSRQLPSLSEAVKARLQARSNAKSCVCVSSRAASSDEPSSTSESPEAQTSVSQDTGLPTLSLARLMRYQHDLDSGPHHCTNSLRQSSSPSGELWRLRRRSSIGSNKDHQINPIRLEIPTSPNPISVYRIEGAEGHPDAGFLQEQMQATAECAQSAAGEGNALKRRLLSPAKSAPSSTTQLGLEAQEDRRRYLCWYRDHHGRQQRAAHLVLACFLAAAVLVHLDAMVSTPVVVCALMALSYLVKSIPSKDFVHSSNSATRRWRRLAHDAGLLLQTYRLSL